MNTITFYMTIYTCILHHATHTVKHYFNILRQKEKAPLIRVGLSQRYKKGDETKNEKRSTNYRTS